MKNPNGYGSVSKMSGNRRRPFVVRRTIGWNEKGHPIYETIGYCKTREEGNMLLADYNGSTIGFKMRGRVYGFLSELVYSIVDNSSSTSILNNLRKWKDIITSVDIGVSAPIWTYDQAGYVYGWTNMDTKVGNDYVDWDKYYSISSTNCWSSSWNEWTASN